jgi:hypothetical protein
MSQSVAGPSGSANAEPLLPLANGRSVLHSVGAGRCVGGADFAEQEQPSPNPQAGVFPAAGSAGVSL